MKVSGGALGGRTALVTGASRGIGREVALRFAHEGAELMLAGRSQESLADVDHEIRMLGGHTLLAIADFTRSEDIEDMADVVQQSWGRLDVLVGNAGVLGSTSALVDIDPGIWDEVIAINLTANWRLLRSFDRLLRASDAGRAIFVTSHAAGGRAYRGAYSASKSALEAMVRSYAQEVAGIGIRVNLIDPGATRTRMGAQAFPSEDPMRLKPADDPRLLDAFVKLASPIYDRTGQTVRCISIKSKLLQQLRLRSIIPWIEILLFLSGPAISSLVCV
jgi:NAD(P)-dependent dehydrogenase (short-subunit alcohol dehydrogenase family)